MASIGIFPRSPNRERESSLGFQYRSNRFEIEARATERGWADLHLPKLEWGVPASLARSPYLPTNCEDPA